MCIRPTVTVLSNTHIMQVKLKNARLHSTTDTLSFSFIYAQTVITLIQHKPAIYWPQSVNKSREGGVHTMMQTTPVKVYAIVC